ncbi:MAG: hypothetical protein COA94_02060 [Rickettsiales bacterium]|nr:MAG: hypothetical protein COA94_02060 [Rickettsiales bacterium]
MSEQLDDLIFTLKKKIRVNHKSLTKVKNTTMLLNSLKDLRDMVGLSELKESISLQTTMLIELMGSDDELGMLNVILYGPPGVGKTKVAIILSRIWLSLGYLDDNGTTKEMIDTSGKYSQKLDTKSFVIPLLLLGGYIWAMCKYAYGIVGLLILPIIFLLVLLAMVGYSYSSSFIGENKILDDQIVIVSRRDFVGDYVGQTAGKTRALLNKNLGKVIFIDEAYSLINGPMDSFGKEALTTLNLHMSMHPRRCVVIFAGYEKELKNGVLKEQPGLSRRCMWNFRCKGYNGEELSEIFFRQMDKDGWIVTDKYDVIGLIENNIKLFSSYGGDTEKLGFYSKLDASRNSFHSDKSSNKTLNINNIKIGLKYLRNNKNM